MTCSVRQNGFSLVEVMIAVAILAIALGIGTPGFQAMFENSRVNRANDALVTAINLARSEAITRGMPAGGRMRVCERNAAGTACSGDQNWGDGLIVLQVDDLGSTVQVVRVWDSVRDSTVTAGAAALDFSRDGAASQSTGFTVTTGSDNQAYCLRLTGSIFQGACPP